MATRRGNLHRFPFEPRVIGGKLFMPSELQAIHRYVVETPVLKAVTEELRAVVETLWHELASKLPPSPDGQKLAGDGRGRLGWTSEPGA